VTMAVQRESSELVFCLCMRLEAIIPVHQMPTRFPWLVFFFLQLWGQLVKRVGDRCELLVGRMGEFFSVKRGGQGWEMDEDLHVKADDNRSLEWQRIFSGL